MILEEKKKKKWHRHANHVWRDWYSIRCRLASQRLAPYSLHPFCALGYSATKDQMRNLHSSKSKMD